MLIQIYVYIIKCTNAWTNKCTHVWSSRLKKLVKPTVHFIWGALFIWHRVSAYLVCSESFTSDAALEGSCLCRQQSSLKVFGTEPLYMCVCSWLFSNVLSWDLTSIGNPSLLIDSRGFTLVWVLETCISVWLALHSTGIIILFIPTGKKGREITESREFHIALTECVCVCVTGGISHRFTVFSAFWYVCLCVCVPQGFITAERDLELNVPWL